LHGHIGKGRFLKSGRFPQDRISSPFADQLDFPARISVTTGLP
jgi:hypothetical protein